MSFDVARLRSETQQLLAGPLRHAKGAALAALLVPLASVGAPTEAEAGVAPPPPTSRVSSTVTEQLNGTFLYEFVVHNTSGCDGSGFCDSAFQLVDWELPFFSLDDLDVGSITAPPGWRFEIIEDPTNPAVSTLYYNNDGGEGGGFYGQYSWDYQAANDPLLDPDQGGDPLLYGPNPSVFNSPPLIIHWYTFDSAQCFEAGFELTSEELEAGFCAVSSPVAPIRAGDSLDGFSFVSVYGSQNAPYLASWFQEPPTSGDPPIPDEPGFGTPLSPARLQAQAVPEPETMALFGLGLLGVALARVARRRKA